MKGVSPGRDYLVGESRTGAGTESRVYLLELKTGGREVILEGTTPSEGYGLVQVSWMNEERMLLCVRQESYSDVDYLPRIRYQILEYIGGSEVDLLVESEAEIHLLGMEDSRLHYLEPDETGSHWSVKHKSLD